MMWVMMDLVLLLNCSNVRVSSRTNFSFALDVGRSLFSSFIVKPCCGSHSCHHFCIPLSDVPAGEGLELGLEDRALELVDCELDGEPGSLDQRHSYGARHQLRHIWSY
eukprot:scaffold1449_cov244-Pinguiococcus_pyrenoidosus.AAC.21